MPTLWPFCPVESFTESLAWRSDVLRAYSAEQRIRLTDVPRRGFAIGHTLTMRQYQRAKLLAEAVGGGAYYLPLWHERQRFSCLSGATSISVDTTACEYVVDGYACLWQDDETCEIVTVSTVGASSLTLSAGAARAYSSALVMPAVVAYCRDGFDASRTVANRVSISGEWAVFAGTDVGASSYPTYRSYPAVTDCPRIGSGTMAERFAWPLDAVDNGLAVPYYDAALAQMSQTLSLAWMPAALADLRALREFFHAIKGRQKAFWVPDWTRGLELLSDIAPASTTITVRAVGLNVTEETGDLFIQSRSGQQHRLRYTAVATPGSSEVLTLSAAAGFTLLHEDVDFACPLRLCRLAQDRVELEHQFRGRDRQITRTQVLCDEVPIP